MPVAEPSEINQCLRTRFGHGPVALKKIFRHDERMRGNVILGTITNSVADARFTHEAVYRYICKLSNPISLSSIAERTVEDTPVIVTTEK